MPILLRQRRSVGRLVGCFTFPRSRSSWSPASASSALGAQTPTPSWGNMVQVGFQYLEIAPWFALVPAAAIFVAVRGFNMLGDGLPDVLDPQSHA